VSNSYSCKKAAIEGAARELHLRGRRSCEKLRKSCGRQLRSASFVARRKKLQMLALRRRNLTLKVKFFQESCNKNKKI